MSTAALPNFSLVTRNCRKVHSIIDEFAERGLRSLGIALQEVSEKSMESHGGPWTFAELLPLFDPPRHDSAETIRRALNLGVCVKMITVGNRKGNRSAAKNGNKHVFLVSFVESSHRRSPSSSYRRTDGFARVFPEHKYEIVKILQQKKHVVGMTEDGVHDAPALKKADIRIDVAVARDAARSASDIVLTEPGLNVIISAILTWRSIFQRIKNYTIYVVSITIRIVVSFIYLQETEQVSSAIYLQISIISQALISVARSQSWSFVERPGALLMIAFVLAQLVATLIAVYANIDFASINSIGWGWAGVIWLYSLVFYIPLDIIKFTVRYGISGDAWKLVFDKKKDFGKDDRAAKWVLSQSLQGLVEDSESLGSPGPSSLIAEQYRRRAKIARLGEMHTLKGHVESIVRLKKLDLNMIQSAYTV